MGLFGKKEELNEIVIHSPVDGTIKSLSLVDDEVFKEKMVGDGIAIVPENGNILSPINGKVKVAFSSGHAYGILVGKELPEVLVHIGIDTVKLKGNGFTSKTQAKRSVKVGSELSIVDLDFIKKNAKSADVIVVITNDSIGEFKITERASGKVKAGDPIYKLIRK